MLLNRFAATAACLLVVTAPALAQQPTSNSTYFEVTDYMMPTQDGQWQHSDIRGYIEQGGNSSKASILILPRIILTADDVAVFDDNGSQFNPADDPTRPVRAIQIRPLFLRDLPTPVEMPAVAGAVLGQPQKFPVLDILRMGDGSAARDGQVFALGPATIQMLDNHQFGHEQARAQQESLVAQIDGYTMEPVAIQGVKMTLTLDNEVLAERVFEGSFVTGTQTLPALTVTRPDAYVSRRLAEGGGEIEVAFRFNDTSVALIDAAFDTNLFISSFVEAHQRIVTTGSSSGFSFLGFSYRRNSIRQSIDQQVRSNFNANLVEGTRIVTLDATDAMMERFEASFFPTITRQQAIESHLTKANEAAAANNPQLEQMHLDYAKSLQDGIQLDEPDMAAAAAALAAQDYAGFLAAGVRAGFESNSNTAVFRRLDQRQVTINQSRTWLDVQKVTVARELSYLVAMEETAVLKPWIGACNVGVLPVNGFQGCNVNFVQPYSDSGILLSCITAGGPLANAGIGAGVVLMAIDGQKVPTMQRFNQVLSQQRVGDNVSLRFFDTEPQWPCTGSRYRSIEIGGAPDFN